MILGVAVGYILGTKSSDSGLGEFKNAVKTIAGSQQVRGLVSGGLGMVGEVVKSGGGMGLVSEVVKSSGGLAGVLRRVA